MIDKKTEAEQNKNKTSSDKNLSTLRTHKDTKFMNYQKNLDKLISDFKNRRLFINK